MKNSMFDNLKAVVADTITDSIKMIDINELHESADNFFIVENIEQFAQTILGQGGVKDNLIVRPLDTGGYEVISGHRRRAAVQYLIEKGENISHYLPCLVQNYADEDDKMLDLILMNVSARQISDQELWKCYETIDKILKEKKDKGEYFGRLRDDIAKTLGVSASQVGKMQNIDKNAIEPVKEAVANGVLSISTANVIAGMDEEEQRQITDLSKVQPKDIKKKAVATSSNGRKAAANSKKKKAETSIEEEAEVDTNKTIVFQNAEHKAAYVEICNRMKRLDCYHRSIAYLIALDTVLRDHADEIFDFYIDAIKPEGLDKGFQTGTSQKTTRLAFNLWNGRVTDGETYTDKNGNERDLPSRYYSPEEIFCCNYAPFYYQAIQIRFETYI